MKHLLFFVLLLSQVCLGQGQYSYKQVDLNLTLPRDTSILGPLQRYNGYVKLGEFEQGFIYCLNYARSNPSGFLKEAVIPYLDAYPNLKLVYGEGLIRELKGLTPVPGMAINETLNGLAKRHALDLGSHNLMSHSSSNGATTQQRFEKAGIICGSECINMSGKAVPPLEVLLSLLVDYNVPNTGHRKSLLNSKMASVGVGTAKGTEGNIQYTVVDLGCM